MKINLNDIEPPADGGAPYFKEQSRNHEVEVDCFFDGLELALVQRISQADMVVGCMAWFTNRRVLKAMSDLKHGCQIIVQKEDFLRPGRIEKQELQRMYSALRCPDRFGLPLMTAADKQYGAWLSYCGDPSCGPIRVMGIAHRKGENGPRMHHKFFVFCRATGATDTEGRNQVEPYAVWTGSFNATENAVLSRENAVYIKSEPIARLYCAEWTRTLALSEPLDWSSSYIEPQWRFGS